MALAEPPTHLHIYLSLKFSTPRAGSRHPSLADLKWLTDHLTWITAASWLAMQDEPISEEESGIFDLYTEANQQFNDRARQLLDMPWPDISELRAGSIDIILNLTPLLESGGIVMVGSILYLIEKYMHLPARYREQKAQIEEEIARANLNEARLQRELEALLPLNVESFAVQRSTALEPVDAQLIVVTEDDDD